MKKLVAFRGCDYPTLGLEQEFHLIDPETADLVPRMLDVEPHVTRDTWDRIAQELLLCVLEMRTGVHTDVDPLLKEASSQRVELAAACERLGIRFAAAASHPFGRWRDQPFVPMKHYRWVRKHHGYIAHRLLAFGMHVHVGVDSGDCAVYIMNDMRQWVWPLLALSANSPYFEGERTSLASTRNHLFGCMPRTGLAPFFRNYQSLRDYYEKHVAAGDFIRPWDLWWQVRPQPTLGTIEVRTFDLQTSMHRIAALVAITQALVTTIQERFRAGKPQVRLDHAYLEENHWKAMRYGLDCNIVEPETGEVISMRAQLQRMLELIRPKAQKLGTMRHIEFAERMIEQGTEADQQVAFCEKHGNDLRLLELDIADRSLRF